MSIALRRTLELVRHIPGNNMRFMKLNRSIALSTVVYCLLAVGLVGCRDTGGTDGGEKTDLLFVIDNSGSMCEEQQALSDRLDTFVANLELDDTSYHFGVTTTHKAPDGLPDDTFDREYGELTSTPTPVPARFGDCGTDPTNVMNALERAIACTESPSQYSDLTQWDDQTENCVQDPSNCTIEDFRLEELFPPQDAYRSIPRVIESEAYRGEDGTLDDQQLVADLRCATFVGTNGWSFEKGLGAGVEAVSPELQSANAGFIREDSSFAAVFISDENDCTHDGSIDELDTGACLDHVCDYENSTQVTADESALESIPTLKASLLENLSDVKSRSDFGEHDVFVAGIYGAPNRYEGDSYTKEQCREPSYPGVAVTCESGELGSAWSGDRYHRFVQSFPTGYPTASTSQPGKVCSQPGFSTALDEISTAIAAWSS
jgi:hypothetical protein